MPHFGLLDESLPAEKVSLMRSRLHVRGGLIRMSEGRLEDAVAALYDALVFAMLHYIESPKLGKDLLLEEGDNQADDRTLFLILKRSGVFDSTVTLEQFDMIFQKMDESIEFKLESLEQEPFMKIYNNIMTQLKAIPFGERTLPRGTGVTI
jgi:hypothetical protein